jgi:hypothetical protein
MKTRNGRPRPDPGCSATDDDDEVQLVFVMKCKLVYKEVKDFLQN